MAASATSALLGAFEDCLRHRKGMSEHTARAYVGDMEKLAAFVGREVVPATGGDTPARERDADTGRAGPSANADAPIDAVLAAVTLEDLRAWLAAMARDGK